jgi:protein-L-isoaspartate(D-aspartate) O-methyltransferase
MKDTYRHKGMRRRMVEGLRQRGIRDEAVLAAMLAVPRHFFLDRAFEEHAYEDKPFSIGYEQTISQPFTVAYQTALLQVQSGDTILEVGTGSGYQAAILAALGAQVFTVERQEGLFRQTQALLNQLGISSVRCFFGDGHEGLSAGAPFAGIIVTAGASSVPDALRHQLAIGGRLVIPVGNDAQQMLLIRRTDAGHFSTETLDSFRFVPFLSGVVKH